MKLQQETSVYKNNDIATGISNAETRATHYITDTQNGVMVHPEGDTDNYVLIQDGVEIYRDNVSVAEYGETTRIGDADKAHINIGSAEFELISGEGTESLSIKVGKREQNIREYHADTTISSVPYSYTASYTPKENSIRVLRGDGNSYNPPPGEDSYSFTNESGSKTITITDSRLVGHGFGVVYIGTDFISISFVGGDRSTAVGARSLAWGESANAIGKNSSALGYRVYANGPESHAEGFKSTASGDSSHAEGYNSTASGDSSHAEGYNSTASGYFSHAEGDSSIASGDFSHAQNLYTIAQGLYQTALGTFNIADTVSALILGNGTGDSNRSNALTVDWNGNVTCGTVNGVDVTNISASIETITDWNTTYDSSKPVRYLFGNNATNTPASGAQIVGIELSNANNNRMQIAFRVGSGTSNSFFVRHAPSGTWGSWTEYGAATATVSTGITGLEARKNGPNAMLYFHNFQFAAGTGTDSTAYQLPAELRPAMDLDLRGSHNSQRFFVRANTGYIQPATAISAATAIRGTFAYLTA